MLDTNVVVSAGIKPGSAPAALVMDWVLEGQVQLVTSPCVVREYREVVRRPRFRRYGFPPPWLEFLVDESLHLADPAVDAENGPDPSDFPFLALARMAGAWLVTGNARHFPEHCRKGVCILCPAEYLAHLAAQ